jgi:hypothetical protein
LQSGDVGRAEVANSAGQRFEEGMIWERAVVGYRDEGVEPVKVERSKRGKVSQNLVEATGTLDFNADL